MKKSYSADMRRYINSGEISFYVEEIAAGAHPALQFHDHKFMELVLVISGTGVHCVETQRNPIARGDVLLIVPGKNHAYDRVGDLGLINLLYDPVRLGIPLLDCAKLPAAVRMFSPENKRSDSEICAPLFRLSDEKTESLYRKIRNLQKELSVFLPGRSFQSMALFMEIVTELARSGPIPSRKESPDMAIGRVIQFLHENFSRKINTDELVKLAYLSRRTLFRYFQRETGCSPQEYLKSIRLMNAAGLLVHTRDSISEIAMKCGFYDSNYFCKEFRIVFQHSPGRFRETWMRESK